MTLAKSFSVGSPYPRLTVLLLRRCKPTCAGPVNLLRRNMNTNTSRETGARLVRAAMKQLTRDRACRLLHEALCDDLELGRLTVHVERDRVSLTIHSKRGRQESKVVVGEDSTTENVRLLDERR
jgi:hypothetical protein